MSLYWKVVSVNGVLFCAGAAALLASPASVSPHPAVSQVAVVALGLTVMLLLNAVLLRRSLGPVDRVIRQMGTVDPTEPGHRLAATGSGPGTALVDSFNAMLDRLEAEQGASSAKALAAREAERHRVAQELHDQVGQGLTVVLLGLKGLQASAPVELHGDLEHLRESARSVLDDVRRVARELRPGVLEDLGLHAALSALVTDFADHGTARVQRSFGPGLPDLPAETELVVYRVAQEALTNAARHSRATRVELSLTKVGGSVVLEVVDDGRGPGDRLVAGSGIRGMRERSALVGGSVEVQRTAEGGTRVRLEVPTGA